MRDHPAIGSLLLCLGLVAVVSCGQGDESEPAVAGDEQSAAEAAEPPAVAIEARGTEEEPLRDGFVAIDSQCSEGSAENPQLGPLDIQIPATWEVKGAHGEGSRSAELTIQTPNVRRTLEVDMAQQRPGSAPEAKPNPEAREIGSVEWAGERYPVYFTDYRFSVYLPAITVENVTDIYVSLSFGGRGGGDLSKVDPDTVIEVFETARLDRCAVETYAEAMQNPEIVFLEDR